MASRVRAHSESVERLERLETMIPFAARDPLRVVPCLMAGSIVAGAISLAAGAQLVVPHGGVSVLPIPHAVRNLGMYVVAIVAGTVVTAVALYIAKRPVEVGA